MEWIKQVTDEELVAQLEAGYQHLNKVEIFSDEHRIIMNEIKMLREEILFRMKST